MAVRPDRSALAASRHGNPDDTVAGRICAPAYGLPAPTVPKTVAASVGPRFEQPSNVRTNVGTLRKAIGGVRGQPREVFWLQDEMRSVLAGRVVCTAE